MSQGPLGLDGAGSEPAAACCAVVDIAPMKGSTSAIMSAIWILIFMGILPALGEVSGFRNGRTLRPATSRYTASNGVLGIRLLRFAPTESPPLKYRGISTCIVMPRLDRSRYDRTTSQVVDQSI